MKTITRFTSNNKFFSRLLFLCIPLLAILVFTSAQAASSAKIDSSEVMANPSSLTTYSIPTDDGWILESAETSNRGGTIDSKTTLIAGDDAKNRQYRSVLSFDTSSIPDNATITSVTLKIKKNKLQGTDPFNIHGSLVADLKKGYFDTAQALQLNDFSAAATLSNAIVIGKTANAGWYTGNLGATGLQSINKLGITQFLLRFTKDDDNDKKADNIAFYAGDAAQTLKPQLVITYSLPKDVTPPAKINSLTAQTGRLDGSVDISWTALGDDGTTGTATTYLVRYSMVSITTETEWNNAIPVTVNVPTPGASGKQEQMTVRNLITGKTYYFAVRAMDEASNTGSLSNNPSAQAIAENTTPETTVIDTTGGKLVADAGGVAVTFPAGAVTEPMTVQYETNNALASMMSPQPAAVFDLTAQTESGSEISQSQKEISIQVSIPKDTPDNNLALYYYDTTNDKWVQVPSTYDKNTSTLTGTTTHFTSYAAFNANTPMITAVSPNPGSAYVGDDFAAKFTVSLSAGPGSVLFVHIGPPTDTHISLGIDYACYSFPAGISISIPVTFTLPSPGAPMSKPYKVWAYYRPSPGSGGNCPTFYQSLPGEQTSSLDYYMGWNPKSPPQISNVKIVNKHSTSALVEWTTDVPADDIVTDHSGNVIGDNNSNQTKTTNHQIAILKRLPGETVDGYIKSCNSFGCTYKDINFKTIDGCVFVQLDSSYESFRTFTNRWVNSLQPEMGGVAPELIPVHLIAYIDNGFPYNGSQQWEPHYKASNIGDLTFKLSLPAGYESGGLQQRGGIFTGESARWKYQTELSGIVPKNDDGKTDIYYSTPAFVVGDESGKHFQLNAEISSGGSYSGNCDGRKTTSPGKYTINYYPWPISKNIHEFIPTENDIKLWSAIKRDEELRSIGKGTLQDGAVMAISKVVGYVPVVGDIISGIIDVGYWISTNLIKASQATVELPTWGLYNYSPAPELTYWVAYSSSGVRRDGNADGTRSYYLAYARYSVINLNPLNIKLLQWVGYRYGYPEWLLTSSANAYFDDCKTIGGQTVSPRACMYAESYSPVNISLTGAGGQIFDKNHKAGSVYETIPEEDGKVGERISVPDGDYQVVVTGLADGTFSLMLTRPFEERMQGILYKDVPIKTGEKIEVHLPLTGYIDPITLPDGTKIFPLDVRAPETSILPAPDKPDGKNGWYVHDIGVTAISIDDLTGIENTQCRVNAAPWFFHKERFFVTEEKIDNLVECFAADKYGNVEQVKSLILKLDKTAPVSSTELAGTAGNHSWFKSDVTVNLNATDNVSGVDYIEYNLDGAGWVHYATPFTISAEGIHNLLYRASDVAGNLEVAQSQEIKIDKTAPILNAWVDKTVYVRLDKLILHYTASDAVSGIDFVTTDLAGDALQNEVPYEILWIPVGKHTITVIAQDMAGWTTEQKIEIEVIATLDSLRALVLRLVELGEINEHTDTSLLAHIDGAIDSYNRGQIDVAIHKLNALIHETEGQTAQHISERANDLLIGDTQYVQEHIK